MASFKQWIQEVNRYKISDDYYNNDSNTLTPNSETIDVHRLAYYEIPTPHLINESFDYTIETPTHYYTFVSFIDDDYLFGCRVLKGVHHSGLGTVTQFIED